MDPILLSPPKPTRTVRLAGSAVLYTPPVMSLHQQCPILHPLNIPSLLPIILHTQSRSQPTSLQPMEIDDMPGKDHSPDMSLLGEGPVLDPELPEAGVLDPGLPEAGVLDPGLPEAVLESRLVSRSLGLSLPQILGEVALQQQDQNQELQAQRQILEKIQQKLEGARARRYAVDEETKSLQRKIYLTEEDLVQSNQTSTRLQKASNGLLVENQTLAAEVEAKQSELEHQRHMFEIYNNKMAQHAKTIAEIESETESEKQLAGLRKRIEKLEEKKKDIEGNPDKAQKLLTGACKKGKELEIVSEEKILKTLQLQTQQLLAQLDQKKKDQATVLQATEVLHKRNSAQLTRLKKRLNEVQGRNRHCKEQAAQLQAKMDQLQQSLDSCNNH